ncbi:MAG TPA: VCBS repeat-containing protein, partial [Cyclobacteriaceae bacterium]|nr:VCBS repeat-containing protein [Cyclobacteriaceae bacterium]
LYLNKGSMKFQDVTEVSGVSGLGGWATGVTMTDVNGDGRLDIYVCNIGGYLNFKGKNQLYINEGLNDQGIPTFTDRAAEYGLALEGFSTQATFFDYDRDGDLDMFMLNHSLHQNGTFGKAGTLRHQVHATAGDKLLRNDNGKFVEVTSEAGIYSSVLGYGLGVVVSDVNLDGWLDIFVGNDFHENDYLYINKGDGTFEEKLEQSMNHTSRYTMGVDFADFNNDAFPDLIAMDMLPGDYQRLKASAAEDPFDVYTFKSSMGYNEQYTRNVLQLNNHDGTFSEIGLFAGISATDWSWASLFADFDLDGDKDIFVSNGILRRSNDLDYINFIEVDSIQVKMKGQLSENELRYIQKMPKVKVQNYLFSNNNDSTFTDQAEAWGMSDPSYSNGAAYADFDNDGDLDLITNNIDEPAFLYENKTLTKDQRESLPKPNYLQIKLEGSDSNVMGIGSKVFLYIGKNLQVQECMPTRGFQSSVDYTLTFGLAKQPTIDSLIVVWNNGQFQTLSNVRANQKLTLKQADASGAFLYDRFSVKRKMLREVQGSFDLSYRHKENNYIEFIRDGLIPFMLSAEGPATAKGDINQDGLEDIYLGGAKWQAGQVFIQTKEGTFLKTKQPVLEADSLYEDVSAVLLDADNDQDLDLFVVSGGNEFYGKSKYMRPRLYLNNGKGQYVLSDNLPELYLTGSCVRASDFDKDGDMDVFLGARAIPWKYGVPPDSYLLVNDGKGKFADATKQVTPELDDFGFVKDATWADMDRDGDDDLIVVAEWKPVAIFYNNQGKLQQHESTGLEIASGWWNTIATADFDNDGDLDMIAGNLGLNSKLKAKHDSPVRMYVNDFDKNDSIEQILTHVVNGVEYPVNTRDEMTKQIPSLKKKYLSYQRFSQAKFSEFFSKDIIQESKLYEANVFESVYIENKGNGSFDVRPLPKATQMSTVNAFLIDDFNRDGNLDILTGGNFYRPNIQMGRYDASFGQLLTGDGKGNFKSLPSVQSGLSVPGEIRKIWPVKVSGQVRYMIVRNNDTVKFLTLNE